MRWCFLRGALFMGGSLLLALAVFLYAEPGLLPFSGFTLQQSAGIIKPVMDHNAVLGGVGVSGLDQGIEECFGVPVPHHRISNVLGVVGG